MKVQPATVRDAPRAVGEVARQTSSLLFNAHASSPCNVTAAIEATGSTKKSRHRHALDKPVVP